MRQLSIGAKPRRVGASDRTRIRYTLLLVANADNMGCGVKVITTVTLTSRPFAGSLALVHHSLPSCKASAGTQSFIVGSDFATGSMWSSTSCVCVSRSAPHELKMESSNSMRIQITPNTKIKSDLILHRISHRSLLSCGMGMDMNIEHDQSSPYAT